MTPDPRPGAEQLFQGEKGSMTKAQADRIDGLKEMLFNCARTRDVALERISELETRLFQENMKNDQQADRLAELEAEVERLREVDRSARAEDLRVVRMERVVEAARHLEVAFETRADDMFTAMDPLFDALRALDERDNQRSHE